MHFIIRTSDLKNSPLSFYFQSVLHDDKWAYLSQHTTVYIQILQALEIIINSVFNMAYFLNSHYITELAVFKLFVDSSHLSSLFRQFQVWCKTFTKPISNSLW